MTPGKLPRKYRGLESSSLIVEFAKDRSVRLPPLSDLKFGACFTKHILEADWDALSGWSSPKIRPFSDLHLHPASSGLHYGLQVFEGLKAYRLSPCTLGLFRPDMNVHRLRKSCERMGLPTFEPTELLRLINALVQVDGDHVPDQEGYSLYIRPVVFATQPTLGVTPPGNAKLLVMCCPVGPYFSDGFKPIAVLADPRFVRAWPGGVGECKAGGNYGCCVMPQQMALSDGCAQMLWLFPDGYDDYYITEVGVMNVFIHWENHEGEIELATFPLEDNLVLPGVTRDSVIQIVKEFGDPPARETRIRMKADVLRALKENRVFEIFGTGTACTICSIGTIKFQGIQYEIPIGKGNVGQKLGLGPLGQRVRRRLLDIQYGRIRHPWTVEVSQLTSDEMEPLNIQGCEGSTAKETAAAAR